MRKFKYLIIVFLSVGPLSCFGLSQYHNVKYDQFKTRSTSTLTGTLNRFETLGYNEYSGVLHVHTTMGGHSDGGFRELIKAAHDNRLDFVGMTEHTSALFNIRRFTLDGKIGDTIFIAGTEHRKKDGTKLLFLGGDSNIDSSSLFSEADKSNVKFDFQPIVSVAYPSRFKDADDSIDAIEVLSLNTGLRNAKRSTLLWDVLMTRKANRPLMIAKSIPRPVQNLKFYDEKSSDRKLVLLAGSDSHSNIGIHLFGDSAGNRLFEIKLDSYETAFDIVRNQVLLKNGVEKNQVNIIEAFRRGHSYTSLRALGDTTGFYFTASQNAENFIMGDTVFINNQVTLTASAPLSAKIVLRKDGDIVSQADSGKSLTYQTAEAGDYRVEAYREDSDAEFNDAPWILTNPIYLRKQQDQL